MVGASLCIAKLNQINKQFGGQAGEALKEWGQNTILISQNGFCPVDTGLLKSTGKSEMTKDTAQIKEVKLSYSTDYAVYVEFDPRPYHRIGQWKYLTTPFNEQSANLEGKIAEKLKGVI